MNWAPVLALMDTQAQFSVTEASVRFIVSVVSDSYVRIAEQNVHDMSWEGRDYSRELPAVADAATGAFHVYDRYGKGGTITGWKLLPDDFKPAPIPVPAAAVQDQVQEGCSVQ